MTDAVEEGGELGPSGRRFVTYLLLGGHQVGQLHDRPQPSAATPVPMDGGMLAAMQGPRKYVLVDATGTWSDELEPLCPLAPELHPRRGPFTPIPGIRRTGADAGRADGPKSPRSPVNGPGTEGARTGPFLPHRPDPRAYPPPDLQACFRVGLPAYLRPARPIPVAGAAGSG